MPPKNYRKKYRKYRRKYKRTQCKEGAVSFIARHAQQIYAGSKMALSVLNAEKKIFDNPAISHTPTSTAGQISLLTDIDQGDDQGNRQGRTLLHKGTFLRLRLNKHASATATTVRVIVFSQHNNSAPAVLGLLNEINIDSFYNSNFHTLSTVYYDKTFSVNADYPEKSIKAYVNKDIRISYSSGTGTDVAMNNMYLLTISDEAINTPTISGRCRIRYYDN